MSQLKFIISIFGDRHVNMLLPLLFSIKNSCPDARASIYWEDITEETKNIIRKSFLEFDFVDTEFNFTKDITRRISSKTLSWEYAARQQKNGDEWLLFIDADTLIIQNPLPFLNGISADVIITQRNESPFLINTGVLACKSGNNIAPFFTQWQKETMHILETPELFSQANDKKRPYGGADQMSLQRLIHYSKERDTFIFQNLIFKSVHCKFLNETYSTPITTETRIIHYKGGWRDIIFFGSPFTQNRPMAQSWEMYVLYIKTFQKSISYINTKLGSHFTLHDWGVNIPWYVNRKTLSIRSPFYYQCYSFFYFIKTFFPRLKKYTIENFF